MKIYSYDRLTREYTGEAEADPSPMEPGKFLIPAFATDIKKPDTAGNEYAVFLEDGTGWEVRLREDPKVEEPVPITQGERAALLRAAVAEHANTVAVGFGYDSIDEAVTYADEPAVAHFQNEGRAFRAWRSLLWDAFDKLLAAIDQGSEPVPADKTALYALLPAFSMDLATQAAES